MTLYAKSVLYDTKLESQIERKKLLEENFPEYIATITGQLAKEFDSYNEACTFVCEKAKVNMKLFNDTYSNEPTDR